MSMSPETAVSPTAQAPPDRPTTSLEEWARTGIALLFGDRVLDMNERRVLRGFLEEVNARAQAAGGIGQGPQQPPDQMGAEQAPAEGPYGGDTSGLGQDPEQQTDEEE